MDDLKLIKKYYGEEMAHLCRKLFPSILEHEGELFTLLNDNFAHNKLLYNDIVSNALTSSFNDYIYSLVFKEKQTIISDKTPKALLDEAGYVLYECKNNWDIMRFKKYYSKGEELCTFREKRLISCFVFFAVKKNVKNIHRYSNPTREDEYGTSVISIQFTRGDVNTLSIKNRYNHMVKNGDATFNNNLENIIPGLTDAFEKKYHLNVASNRGCFDIHKYNYVLASDLKYYRYNAYIHNVYYCNNNIIIDNGKIVTDYLDKARYIVFDYFILDLKEKKLKLYDNSKIENDSFINSIGVLRKIDIKKYSGVKTIIINDYIRIILNENNAFIGYENDIIDNISDNFLMYNNTLRSLIIPNVRMIGNDCLYLNQVLEDFIGENVEEIGDNFLTYNKCLIKFEIANLKRIGRLALYSNNSLECLYAPNLEVVEKGLLCQNKILKNLYVPKLKMFEKGFLECNKKCELLIKLLMLKIYMEKRINDNKVLTKCKKGI